MKYVKDVSFETVLFSVNEECINIKKADKIYKKDDTIFVEVGYRNYEADGNSTILNGIRYNSEKLFLNLTEAQEEQAKLRKEKIADAYEVMIGVQNDYNELIERFFNKPLSNPFKEKQ